MLYTFYRYIYFYEKGNPAVTDAHINGLIALTHDQLLGSTDAPGSASGFGTSSSFGSLNVAAESHFHNTLGKLYFQV